LTTADERFPAGKPLHVNYGHTEKVKGREAGKGSEGGRKFQRGLGTGVKS